MELVVKHYSELTADELYDILHVRVLVFVVEQKCPYEEVDGRDRLLDEVHKALRALQLDVLVHLVGHRRGAGKVWRGDHPHRGADLRPEALRGSRLPAGRRGISGGRYPPHPDDLARAERLIHDV